MHIHFYCAHVSDIYQCINSFYTRVVNFNKSIYSYNNRSLNFSIGIHLCLLQILTFNICTQVCFSSIKISFPPYSLKKINGKRLLFIFVKLLYVILRNIFALYKIDVNWFLIQSFYKTIL